MPAQRRSCNKENVVLQAHRRRMNNQALRDAKRRVVRSRGEVSARTTRRPKQRGRQGNVLRGQTTASNHRDEYEDSEAEDEERLRQNSESILADDWEDDEDEAQGTRGRAAGQSGQRGGRGCGGRGQARHRARRTPTKRASSEDQSAARAGRKKTRRPVVIDESGEDVSRTQSVTSHPETAEETGRADGGRDELAELRAFRRWAVEQDPGMSVRFAQTAVARERESERQGKETDSEL